jgi:hypothetical protein
MSHLSSVSEHLLAPGGLSIDSLQSVLGELAGPGIDAADLYFQGQISESGRWKTASSRKAASTWTRASASARNRVRKPASPTATPSPLKH